MENIMLFYVVLYMILGLVIYHSIFEIWYFNFGKALIGELFGAFLFAALMTGLTLKFWLVALIIIILIGLMLSAKVNTPTGKKIVIGIFVVIAIITAITGIRYNKQEKDKAEEVEQQEKEAEEEVALYYTPTDTGVYLKENSDIYSIIAGKTYVSKENGYCFANVQYDSETKGIVDIQFFVESNGQFYMVDGYYEFQNNVDKPLVYVWVWDDYGQLEVNDAESFVVKGAAMENDGINGTYKLASDEDVAYYESNSQDEYDYESDSEGYEDDMFSDYSEYILPNSNVDILTEYDLENLNAQELTYARNEIYARHGYIFKSSELNDYFAGTSWYEPDESFSGTLEGVEQQNAAFISEYQKNNGLEYKVN